MATASEWLNSPLGMLERSKTVEKLGKKLGERFHHFVFSCLDEAAQLKYIFFSFASDEAVGIGRKGNVLLFGAVESKDIDVNIIIKKIGLCVFQMTCKNVLRK